MGTVIIISLRLRQRSMT